MSFISRLFRGFGSKPHARSVADRLGGYEPPVEARPWTPSEPPPELPWERDENGPLADPPPSAQDRVRPIARDLGPADGADPAAAPQQLDQFRSDDELPNDGISRRFG